VHQIFSAIAEQPARTVAGFLLGLLVALAAGRAHSLTNSGIVASTVVGGSVVAGTGWWPGVILVVYFVSSSGLSSLTRATREPSEQARGKERDAWQVLANGGVAAAFALASLLVDHPGPLIVAALGSISGAAADTWATELGRFGRSHPRLFTTGQRVPSGTSGAISSTGTIASITAAVCIGLLASVPASPASGLSGVEVGIVVASAGMLGSFTDSLLGATVQERRWCPSCHKPTEQRVHRCGSVTAHAGGVQWITNDVVNCLAVLVAGTSAALGATMLG
jgi:uncharacterized protein (TIGR00297 family)